MLRLGGYRIHNQSLSSKKYLQQGILSKYVAELRHSESFSTLATPLPEFIAKIIKDRDFIKLLKAKHYFRQAGSFFISKKYLTAILYATWSFFLSPKYAIRRFCFRVYSIIIIRVKEHVK
jgi:hypothetical protein